jgi:hypothetical protein
VHFVVGVVMKNVLVACALTLWTTSGLSGEQQATSAQPFSRLAGTWELDTAGNPSLPAERRVITVFPDSFHVEIVRAEDARPPKLTYRFDGQDTVSAFGSGKATARLVRENAGVVTETVYEINNSPITIRDLINVNANGTELTLHSTVRVEHGYQGPLPAGESKPPNVSTAMVVFVKRK